MPEIKALLQGFQRFRGQLFEPNRDLFNQLARKGQSPKVLVIGCSDSRVDPAIILDTAPGELFVVRNVANLVPPCELMGMYHGTSAALEFAVCHLQVKSIIVLGHAQCGGIRALLESDGEQDKGTSFIAAWVKIAVPAREKVLARWPAADKEFQQRACERASILVSLENLLSFPFVKERVEDGSLRLFGWYFDIDSGELLQYDPERRRFHDLYFDYE